MHSLASSSHSVSDKSQNKPAAYNVIPAYLGNRTHRVLSWRKLSWGYIDCKRKVLKVPLLVWHTHQQIGHYESGA